MSKLEIPSSNSGTRVEFSSVEGDKFRASIFAQDHSATLEVSAYTDHLGVVNLFADAAQHWKGWQGAKVWKSLEDELHLELRTDSFGHVTMLVRMKRDHGRKDRWSLESELGIDAGQLDRIALDAARLWRFEG